MEPRFDMSAPHYPDWQVWREIIAERPGVAGAHLALFELSALLEAFSAELERLALIERDQPNEGRYDGWGEDLETRNLRNDIALDNARDHIRAAAEQLADAAQVIVERWPT